MHESAMTVGVSPLKTKDRQRVCREVVRLLLLVITFTQGVSSYIPDVNHVSKFLSLFRAF